MIDAHHNTYAGALASNFGNQASDGYPDWNGIHALRGYPPVGPRERLQARAFYGSLNAPGQTDWTGFLYGINLFRMAARCSKDPIFPWIATKSRSWLLANSDYWDDYLFHTVLVCGDNPMLFNPTSTNGDADMTLYDAKMGEMNARAQGEPWVSTLDCSKVDWKAGYVVSGAKFGDHTVRRITFGPGVTSAVVDGVKVNKPANDVGVWI